MPLSCRLYANEFPKVNDTVMVRVKKIAEMGAYVTLKEYNNKGITSTTDLNESVRVKKV